MAKDTGKQALRYASLTKSDMRSAIKKLERRRSELIGLTGIQSREQLTDAITAVITKINGTYDDIYGADTVEAQEARVSIKDFTSMYAREFDDRLRYFDGGRISALADLGARIELFAERLADEDAVDTDNKVLRAYESLDLHQEIARAASDLYRDGHYANAIVDAIKALNSLVRLRSGLDDLDGSKLMTTAFAPETPVLKFNALADANDKDEQRGFMMMFSGAVAGLRNPRAHKLIKDDPERALEFIAFISLLAKLLDGAKK